MKQDQLVIAHPAADLLFGDVAVDRCIVQDNDGELAVVVLDREAVDEFDDIVAVDVLLVQIVDQVIGSIVECAENIDPLAGNGGVDIMWRAEMTEQDYDKRYLALCETVDELRAIADLSIPEASKPIESMYLQMNLFWGNFKDVLRLTRLGETYDKKQYALSKAHEAAREIARHINLAKGILGTIEQ